MEPTTYLRHLHDVYFSRPREDRALFRRIAESAPACFVQLGIGDGRLTERVLATALRFAGERRLRYVGIDLFEGRSADSPGLTLKEAHRRLAGNSINVKLVPGDPFSGLMRVANSVQNVDLMLVADDLDAESLERAWRYVPRMLQATSVVYRRDQATSAWRIMGADELRDLAEATRRADRPAA